MMKSVEKRPGCMLMVIFAFMIFTLIHIFNHIYPTEKELGLEEQLLIQKEKEIYEILVGEDSTSILNTVKRIEAGLDSICRVKYGKEC